MYEGMTLKEIQDQMRSEKIAEFGEVGLKEDCMYCQVSPAGTRSCQILYKMYCKSEVCQFYDNKG